MGPPAIDIHVHIQPWGMLLPAVHRKIMQGRKDADLIEQLIASPAKLVAHLDKIGIERAVLINYASPDLMGFTDDVNDWVSRYCKTAPDRLVPCGSVHPRFSKGPRFDIERLLDKLAIKVVKLHPPHQLFFPNAYRDGGPLPGLRDVYQACEERGVPVMFHTGTSIFPGARSKYGDPIAIDDVAVDFPSLPIILAHGGRPLWMETVFFLMRRHPNVHMDISGIPPKSLLEYFPRLAEVAGRVLFGSDWPSPGVPGIRENVDAFAKLPLDDALKGCILRDNARRLLGG